MELEYQTFPSASYKWGVFVMTSAQTATCGKWFKTKKAAIADARSAYIRNPVLARWHAENERM